MTRRVRIATVSFLSHPSPVENVEAGLKWIDEAGEQRVDLIVFPEDFIYHQTKTPIAEQEEPVPGPLTGRLAARAAYWNMNAIIPTTECEDGRLYNTAAIFNRCGEVVGKYRKTHITLSEIERGIRPGMELPVFDLDFGKVSILTCFDFWFPEICLVYALKGAEVICLADMKTGPSLYDIMLRLQAMAAITMTYIVQAQFSQKPPYAPYAGRHRTGRGSIAGPEGIILADTGHKPGLAVATVDLDEPRLTKDAGYYGERVNFKMALRNYRRPELYGEIARPRSDHDRIDGLTKEALDRARMEQGLPPYPGVPFWPKETPDDPEIFPPK
ncbi:MAG: carbon-nitrogen hydrolase family protein [Anaerolineae bacterium]|nr:carbon-nitrogen hydrolase family protein [Anaerolineae bacterium]